MKPVIVTNTPRAGESAEQTAVRTAPRIQRPYAKLFFITQEGPGMFFVNLDDGKTFQKLQITRGQLSNAVCDGAIMWRSTETRR